MLNRLKDNTLRSQVHRAISGKICTSTLLATMGHLLRQHHACRRAITKPRT